MPQLLDKIKLADLPVFGQFKGIAAAYDNLFALCEEMVQTLTVSGKSKLDPDTLSRWQQNVGQFCEVMDPEIRQLNLQRAWHKSPPLKLMIAGLFREIKDPLIMQYIMREYYSKPKRSDNETLLNCATKILAQKPWLMGMEDAGNLPDVSITFPELRRGLRVVSASVAEILGRHHIENMQSGLLRRHVERGPLCVDLGGAVLPLAKNTMEAASQGTRIPHITVYHAVPRGSTQLSVRIGSEQGRKHARTVEMPLVS